MLNIAPLDYERYAALYAPPQMLDAVRVQVTATHKSIEEISPASSELARHRSPSNEKSARAALYLTSRRQVQAGREIDRLLGGLIPIDLQGFFEIPGEILKATPEQRGPTPEKVAELYESRGKGHAGTLRISA